MPKANRFEKKYYQGKHSCYSSCLDYKNENIAYLFKNKILSIIGRELGQNNQRIKILDIGSAFGYLLSLFDEHKFQTYGLDISKYALKIAQKKTKAKLNKIDVNKGLPYKDNSFFIVTALDIIEHLDSPSNFVLEVKRVLKKNGLFFLHTLNINSIFEGMFKNNWFGYKDKTHWYLFNRKSLGFLVKKAGFKILENKTICYPLPMFIRSLTEKTDIGGSIWLAVKK